MKRINKRLKLKNYIWVGSYKAKRFYVKKCTVLRMLNLIRNEYG